MEDRDRTSKHHVVFFSHQSLSVFWKPQGGSETSKTGSNGSLKVQLSTANNLICCELVFVFLLVGAYQDISWPFRYRDTFIDQSQTWGGLERYKTGCEERNGRDCRGLLCTNLDYCL